MRDMDGVLKKSGFAHRRILEEAVSGSGYPRWKASWGDVRIIPIVVGWPRGTNTLLCRGLRVTNGADAKQSGSSDTGTN